MPLAVIELKNPADENATIKTAHNQLQTYKTDIPSLFTYNELLVTSDGTEARLGTLTAGWEWFLPWRTSDGVTIAPKTAPELEVDASKISKKVAAYHQYHAVNAAVKATLKATSPRGDKRVGVVWHTQGAGKSLTMVFYAGKIVLHPAMQNPTLVVFGIIKGDHF